MLISIGVCVIVFIILISIYATGNIGAGDVKYYSIFPLFISLNSLFQFYWVVFCVGAVLACVKLLSYFLGNHILHILGYLRAGGLFKPMGHRSVSPSELRDIPLALPPAIVLSIVAIMKYMTNITS